MAKGIVFLIAFVLSSHLSKSSVVFHENTNVIFQPEYDAEYFGFSTLMSPDVLLVGAPKASDTAPSNGHESGIKPGMVFSCPLVDLSIKHVNCTTLKKPDRRSGSETILNKNIPGFVRDDMWFGASMVFLSNSRLMINAPRWTAPYGKKHLLMNGATLLQTKKTSRFIFPLKDYTRQAYVSHGERREYGEYGTHLNFYAYGQAGMSAAVTKMNTVILGAPGLLQWAGGIICISFYPDDNSSYMSKLPTSNPYYTRDLGPDDYFGYSVNSGIFSKNGSVLYVGGAPRSNIASGQVLVFEPPTQEQQSLNVKARIKGPQSGSYFGASLCCTDINGDGLDDLLIGAPTFVKNDGGLPYDQGAVFVYLTKEQGSELIFEEYGHVFGSATNGAWFGISIADLGDVNGDGFKDVAIGAPWENDGTGAVYIYKGCKSGLNRNNVQRIQPKGAKGFGWSIAKGVDVDRNNCNDLAIGAHNSQATYLYRCIPTMVVHPVIKVPNAINLPQNITGFKAIFCVTAPSIKTWSHVEINIIAKIEVDPESNRAMLSGDSTFTRLVKPGTEVCDEQTIEVHPTANLTKPITLALQLQADELMKDNSSTFLMNAARLSEESTLKTTFLVQLVRDCGEDLICTPWLVMTLEALDNPYIPGSNTTLGVRVTIFNKEEPAYGAKVNISLPMPPKRIPSDCSLQDLNMICDAPVPLLRDEDVTWDIELDYHMLQKFNQTEDIALNVRAELRDTLYRNVTNDAVKEIAINVTHEANFTVSGKAMLNSSMVVLRKNLAAGANVTFKHYFEITNHGPSDWSSLFVHIVIPEKTNLSTDINGCEPSSYTDAGAGNAYECVWSVPAKVSLPVFVPLQMDLSKEGNFLSENITYNATTHIFVRMKDDSIKYSVTTTLNLEPESLTWKLILPCVLLGLLILAGLVYILYKTGFFRRTTHKMLQQQKNTHQRLIQESDTSSSHNDDVDDDDVPLEEIED